MRTMQSLPDVSIVIPAYGRPDALILTLEELTRLDFPREAWEAIVVDDGSPEDVVGTVEAWARQAGAPVRALKQRNAGPAAARNKGAAAARGKFLIFIDNDILVEPDFLQQHLAALAAHPRCWIVGRVIQPEELRKTPFGRFRDGLHESFHHSFQPGQLSETIWITTQNLSMPRADFEALGGFDESFTIASSEDWELGCRARQQGIRMLYHPGIAVRHNDWAVNLPKFCERQWLYSVSDVLLWRKYGEDIPRAELVHQNDRIHWGQDRPKLVLKKLVKSALALPPGRAAVSALCRATELAAPDSRLNHRAYQLAAGVAIFRGVREGLRRYPEGTIPDRKEGLRATDDPASRPLAPSVSIIIPTHNRRGPLLTTLAALCDVAYPSPWEVIVVDDGSTDGTDLAIREQTALNGINLRYLWQENSGPAAARNRGAAAAAGDVLIFIDDDILVKPDFVADHADALLQNPGCWVSGRIAHPEELRSTPFGEYRDAVWERFHQRHPQDRLAETSGGSAANLSLWAADFERLGGFDESFHTPSCEDWDLGIRARAAGIRVLYHPLLVTQHMDWAAQSLDHFCDRQRQYSIADVLLWRKYGDSSPRLTVIQRNAWIRWGKDSPHLIWKKAAKRLLSTPDGQRFLRWICARVEAAAPRSRLSHWTYDVAVAVAIFRGVREGLARRDDSPAATPGAVQAREA
ncbi:MAG: glycosyltransferase family 2 protein [Actinomycetota bacterium]